MSLSPALASYLRHKRECDKLGPIWEYPRYIHDELTCSCGLDVAMKQTELFGARVEYAGTGWIHCKTRAILSEPIDYGDCVNRKIWCGVCGAERDPPGAKDLRKPRNLDRYTTAEQAARGLEDLARDIRAHADGNPLVKWHINLSVWNPAWEAEKKLGE